MTVIGAFMVPHPPIIIPTVGKGAEKAIASTINGYDEVGRQIAALAPETILVISPHTVAYADYFHIAPGAGAEGDFGQFRAPETAFRVTYDTELVKAISAESQAAGLPVGTMGERDKKLDHGVMVPLFFVNKFYTNYKLVRMGFSGLPLPLHYRVGMVIAQAIEKLSRKVVIIASGDLSHKLKEDGPYGFDPAGPEYDEKIMKVMSKGDFGQLLKFPASLNEAAAECGHRSFTIMAGALDGKDVKATALSHQGNFGVGYGICTFYPEGANPERHFLASYKEEENRKQQDRLSKEDPYIALARKTINNYVETGKIIPVPKDLPQDMLNKRAGTFVSLHKDGQLRGCIGTINPVTANIAQEIINNGVSAATHDPRFAPVHAEELPYLEISVDVLGPIEEHITDKDLDVKRYGVIVTKGGRRGLLLPNLDGVDTIEDQIAIAEQKAGIAVGEIGVDLARFEVIRHEVK
jgi:AmmeMemoRadiSam system protein A/AmmeMemoRadiSam system protein B